MTLSAAPKNGAVLSLQGLQGETDGTSAAVVAASAPAGRAGRSSARTRKARAGAWTTGKAPRCDRGAPAMGGVQARAQRACTPPIAHPPPSVADGTLLIRVGH